MTTNNVSLCSNDTKIVRTDRAVGPFKDPNIFSTLLECFISLKIANHGHFTMLEAKENQRAESPHSR